MGVLLRIWVLLFENKVGSELWVYSSSDSLNKSNLANSKSSVRPSWVRRVREDPGAGFYRK